MFYRLVDKLLPNFVAIVQPVAEMAFSGFQTGSNPSDGLLNIPNING